MLSLVIKDNNVFYSANVLIIILNQNLFFNKKNDPTIAGIAKLMIHSEKLEKIIPAVFILNKPIKNIAKDVLIPSSAIVVVGIIVVKR